MDNHIVITILILLIVGLLFFLAYINTQKVPQKKREKIFERLSLLKEQVKSEEVFARRDAIIKLDNLLSKSLQIKYSNDKKCGDNLKLANKLFNKKNYQEIWDVHKLRNEIVHKDIEVSVSDAQEAYEIYKMGINKILR
jgi:uncharacterized protein YutE (UPF0331/DUF86 family)